MSSLETPARVLALSLGITIGASFYDGTLFGYHPALLSMGFLILMTEGVIRAIRFRKTLGPARGAAIWTHAFFQFFGVLSIAAGFAVIYENKKIHGKPHFTTYHGKLGVAAVALALGATFGGALSFRTLGLLTKLPDSLQPQVKKGHRAFGLLVYLLGLLAIELALGKPSMQKGTVSLLWRGGVALLAGLVLALWAPGVLYRLENNATANTFGPTAAAGQGPNRASLLRGGSGEGYATAGPGEGTGEADLVLEAGLLRSDQK